MWNKLHSIFPPILLSLMFLLSGPPDGWSGSCCGQGGGPATFIVGDNWAQMTLSISNSTIIGDVNQRGETYFRERRQLESIHIYQLDGTLLLSDILSDRWQGGFTLPFVTKTKELSGEERAQSGVGDLRFKVIYEFMTEQNFHPWRPRGFVYSQIGPPIAPSPFDFKRKDRLDVRGKGVVTSSLGMAFVKLRDSWDVQAQFEYRHYFSKTHLGRKIAPAWGMSSLFTLGLGLPSNFHLGIGLAPRYESAQRNPFFESPSSLVWESFCSLAYSFSRDWSSTISYLDQTLIGPSKNTYLSRGLTLAIQKSWSL